MKFWRPGITGKLFIAILATCIVLLISMHWAVRISFERGFIDYIKRGNEQRLTMLGDALSEKAGVLAEVRRREFYEKPTTERKRAKASAVKRHAKKLARENARRTRLY